MEHMGYENMKQIQIQHEPTHDFIWNIIFMWVALAAMFTYVYHPPVITIFIGWYVFIIFNPSQSWLVYDCFTHITLW